MGSSRNLLTNVRDTILLMMQFVTGKITWQLLTVRLTQHGQVVVFHVTSSGIAAPLPMNVSHRDHGRHDSWRAASARRVNSSMPIATAAWPTATATPSGPSGPTVSTTSVPAPRALKPKPKHAVRVATNGQRNGANVPSPAARVTKSKHDNVAARTRVNTTRQKELPATRETAPYVTKSLTHACSNTWTHPIRTNIKNVRRSG